MPQSLAKVYLHIVFSTKNRKPLIRNEIKEELHKYLSGIARDHKSSVIAINSVEDHVHILCLLSRNITISKLLEELKKSSSKWIKTKGDEYKNFYWQNGYGAFSVSQSNVNTVKKYIANQKQHHRKKTFKEEYIEFLEKYEIEYDEKYIWD